MFDLLKSLFGIGGKALDKIFPDRAKLQEKNLEINAETERASGGRMAGAGFAGSALTAIIIKVLGL